jgi:hypothetical protein
MAMSCPYLNKCTEKVTESDYERFCKCNYWRCDTYEQLSESEEPHKMPAEWEKAKTTKRMGK